MTDDAAQDDSDQPLNDAITYPAANPDEYAPGDDWTLAWSDEFDQASLDTNVWTRQVLLNPFNNEWQRYTGDPDTAYTKDGYLVLKAEWTGDTHGSRQYTSARLISNPGGNDGEDGTDGKTFQYGKIAARIQLPYGKGMWPAFWMLGDNISETGGDTNWPTTGEIDILEAGSQYADDGAWGHKTLGAAIHYDKSPNNSSGSHDYKHGSFTSPTVLAENFHVYEIEWDADQVIWRLDGDEFFRVDISDPVFDEFRMPFYLLFNIAVGGHYTYDPDDTTPFPQYMYVDWVRHYTKE